MDPVKVKFKRLHQEFKLPTVVVGDSGIDMRACIDESVIIMPRQRAVISLGCSVEVPVGWEIQVRPRSGLALKEGITVLNSPGTIDAQFRGLCQVILINHSENWFKVNPQDRICQFVVQQVPAVELELVDELTKTDRQESGFGSSGVK